MINKACTDQLDDAIDSFEENWSTDSRSEIRSLLGHFDLSEDHAALTELIRIDIELRYRQGISIRLEDYFDQFEELLTHPHHVAQIAFEDYRSRAAYGHSVSSGRWSKLPGVCNEVWYQELTHESATMRSRGLPAVRKGKATSPRLADPAFASALETIGFRLIDELGRGALSHVYLATQNDLADRYVVLKVVKNSLAEPQNLAMLQHTNIVPIYSYHRVQSRSVICMPYSGGVTLADFLSAEQRTTSDEAGDDGKSRTASRGGQSLMATVLDRVQDTVIASGDEGQENRHDSVSAPAADDDAVLKPLERLSAMDCNELALWIFQRLAAALAHSHARGVLHGDLKPANVLIRNDGEPALLDFNLSQSLARGQVQHFGGTLPYMPPESYRALMGQSVAPDSTSDIYGLGVMLFEFVTGRLPYAVPRTTAEVDLEPAIRWRCEEPDWRNEDQVSLGLRAIINRCLAFEPADRYASAEQLQKDLDNERQDLPLSFGEESRLSRTQKWVRRHPRFVSGTWVASVLFAILMPVTVLSMVRRDHSEAAFNVKSFARESADALSAMAVNPIRESEPSILAAMQPLESYGLLDASRAGEFDSFLMSAEQKEEHRATALRHLCQVAYAEIDRLNTLDEANPDLDRLNRLVDALLRVEDGKASRASLFIQAEQAKLAGDLPASLALAKKAESMSWQDDDTNRYLEAIRLLALEDYQTSREILASLTDRERIPSAVRWTLLGRSQYHAGQYEDAKLSFTQSIEHAPDASRLWRLRGLCYYKAREYARAIDDFTRAIELEPTLHGAWTTRGLCKAAMGDFAGAIEDYDAVLRAEPQNARALVLRCRSLRKSNKRIAAQRDLQLALQLEDLDGPSLVARADERFKMGDTEGALADYEIAYEMDAGNPMLLKNMAAVLSKLKQYPEAIACLSQAIQQENGGEKSIIDRAVLLARLGRYDEAQQDLRNAVKLPNAPVVLYQAACVHALLPDEWRKPIALAYLSKALQAGFDASDLENDPDLESLHQTEGYQSIVETIELGHRLRRKKSTLPATLHPNGPVNLDE